MQIGNVLPQIMPTGRRGNYGCYEIGPFETGFAIPTVGNPLRRILLSSLPGAAVTSLRIEGVQHEFQAIENVQEDVTEIVLNVKRLRLRSFSDQLISMPLEVSGERDVTAADISTSSIVEIVNPDLHLATLDNENAHLVMDLWVGTGRGFVRASSKEDQPIGVIPVDALYSPIQKVNATVKPVDGSGEILVLEITTDGAITPDEALREGASLLLRHFNLFATYHRSSLPDPEKTPLSTFPIPQAIYDTLIEELDLSVRAYRSLKRCDITKVGQILSMTDGDLLDIRNFGEKSLQELRERLNARHLLPGQGNDQRKGDEETPFPLEDVAL